MSTDAAIDYIRYMDESRLLLPFENYVGKLQDKEMNRKYYFIDNGLLATQVWRRMLFLQYA